MFFSLSFFVNNRSSSTVQYSCSTTYTLLFAKVSCSLIGLMPNWNQYAEKSELEKSELMNGMKTHPNLPSIDTPILSFQHCYNHFILYTSYFIPLVGLGKRGAH